MSDRRREEEARVLEGVMRCRQEHRMTRAAALVEERERRHARGEVYVAGCWVPQAQAGRITQMLKRREFLVLIEVAALLMLLVANAFGTWYLFGFLLLP